MPQTGEFLLANDNPTCYAYDANGHLTQVVSPGGQTRTYVHDDLGHLTSETTPESGATTFTYDNAGYMLTRTDARNITTTYRYKENDAMHRLVSIAYSDSTPGVTYTYDETYNYNFNVSIANGLGRRTGMADGSGETAWSYDVMGRVVKEWRTIAGVTNTIQYSYNLDGSLASVTYPDNNVVNYTYSNAQRPTSVTDGFNSYAQNATYAPQGALASVLLGQALPGFRGITETWAYNNDLETTSITASSSNGTALSLGYSYALPGGNNGSVAGVTNGLDSGRNESMTYDPLNRILTAQTAASSGQDCWGLGFGTGNGAADDPLGDLLSMSVTKCSGPSLSVSVNGNNQLTATGFSYDAAGNPGSGGAGASAGIQKADMTSGAPFAPRTALRGGQRTYAYNAENEMTSAGGTTYIYDGDGLRAQRASNILNWRDSSGRVIEQTDGYGDVETDYVFFAGRRIASSSPTGGINYLFTDTLGSTRAATDASGNVCFSADYYPYGQENDYVTTCAPAYRFAGYKLDGGEGSSLYYAHARYYSPSLGRFMSPDPLGGHPANPQSLDRYAYVVNNPGTLNDPSGRYPLYPVEAPCEMGSGYDCDPSEGLGGWGDPFQLAFGGGESCAGGDCESWWGIDQSALDVYLLLLEDSLGDTGDGSGKLPAQCDPRNPINVRALKFILGNLAAADKLAAEIRVPVQDILGLAGEESAFGTSAIALNANNFFGLHARATGSNGTYTTQQGVSVASFASPGFLTSGQSFVSMFGSLVAGVADPKAFAEALVGTFNAASTKAGGNPAFVALVTGTIQGIKSRLNCGQH